MDRNVGEVPAGVAMSSISLSSTEEADLPGESIFDTGLENGIELQHSSSEGSAKEEQDSPEAVSESKAELMDIADEKETREETHSENAAIASTLEGETEDLPSSQQSSSAESAHALEKEVHDTPEAVLDYSESKAEPMDTADEKGTGEENHSDNAAIASTLEGETEDLPSSQQSSSEESAHALEKEVHDTPEDVSKCKAKPMVIAGEKETREETDAAIASALEGETKDLPSSEQQLFEPGKYAIQLQCESNAPGGVCTVNVVGTAHVLKASCEEVEACIRHVKPEVVFLELCSKRTDCLFPAKLKVPTFSNMLEAYKKKEMNLFGLLYAWYLARVGEKLEILPGAEFRIAYEEALKCGASVILGDRPIEVTLKRTWGKLSLWHKTRFIFSALTEAFNLPSLDEIHALLEQSDELTRLFEELSKTYPTLSETLIVERDLYMVASLRNVARRHSSVVAVVGLGHLPGIAKHWKEDINVEELMTIPSKNSINSRKWFWSKVALGVGGIVAGVALLRQR